MGKFHDNAIIWLQEDEEEGVADCGCRLIADEDNPRFIMCSMHKASEKLYNALAAAWSFIENVTNEDPDRSEKFFSLREQVRKTFEEALKGGAGCNG